MQTLQQAAQSALSRTLQPTPSETLSDDAWRPLLDAYEPTLVRASDACARFIADIAAGRDPYWLTLSGVGGCGKTMLARQVYIAAQRYNPGNSTVYLRNEFDPHDRRPRCVWLDARDMFGRMVAGEHDLPEYLARDWLVVIDDLGAGRDKSEYFADAIGRLANLRLHKWTLFTTNLTHREVRDQIGDRVASRMIRDENKALRIKARDYALRKHNA